MKFAIVAAIFGAASACDLVPEYGPLMGSWVIDTVNADEDPCLQAENCLSGSGDRTVLRFDSSLANIGSSDCKVGWTPSCPSGNVPSDQYPFHWDQCHRHWHLTGFSDYKLKDLTTGQMVASGYKNGLCLMDIVCSSQRYTCQNQGLTVGCKDIYDKTLQCQWIDVTDIDQNTEYEFEWRTNIDRNLPETNYDNNIVTARVNLATVPRYRVPKGPSPNQCPGRGSAFGGGSSFSATPQYTPVYTPTYSSPSQTSYSAPTRSYSSYTPSYSSYSSTPSYSGYSSSYTGRRWGRY